MVPDMEEVSGVPRNGATSPGRGADHKDIAKQIKKKLASETAVRKRMVEYASKLMDFDWVRERWHEGCQRGKI